MNRIKEWIKKHKIVTVIIIIIVIILFILRGGTEKKISTMPTPTPVKFQLIKTFPFPGEQETAFPATAIQFSFTKAVDRTSLKVIIIPEQNYTISFRNSDKDIFIQPTPFWKLGINYTINLSVNSKDLETIDPISYSFKFILPKSSTLEERPL